MFSPYLKHLWLREFHGKWRPEWHVSLRPLSERRVHRSTRACFFALEQLEERLLLYGPERVGPLYQPLLAEGEGPATATVASASTDPQYTVKHPPRLQIGNAKLVGYSGSETDQVDVLWETIPAGSGTSDSFTVQFRQVGQSTWSNGGTISTIVTGVEGRIIHSSVIAGMAYDTDYEYLVQHLRAGAPIATYQKTFHTRLPVGSTSSFSFAAYGDSANLSNISNFRSVQNRINLVGPQFAVLLGDNIYDMSTHIEADTRFDPAINPEAALWNSSHIDYPGIGNHETDGGSLGKPYEEMFSVPIPVAGQSSSVQPPSTERAEHNYSFDYGGVHFLTFDSNSNTNATRLNGQLTWAEQDLQASNAHWKIVFFHHPIGASLDTSAGPTANYYQQVVPRLRAAGADLLLVGHSHSYSRTYPLLGQLGGLATYVLDTDNNYAEGAGLIQVLSGLGGKERRSGSYSHAPYTVVGYSSSTTPASVYGFSLIQVTSNQLTVSYIAASNGQVVDSFTLTGAVPNNPPVAANDSYAIDEDAVLNVATAQGVLSNDTDADGNSLTAALVTTVTHGSLTLNSNGSFGYTPVANYHGPDSFTYRASDGFTTSAVATATLTVNSVNDKPVVTSQSLTTLPGTALPITLIASDVDGNPLTYSVGNASHGTLTGTAPNLTYTPNSGFAGNDSFVFHVNDGTVDSDVATISVFVHINLAPVANGQSVTTNEDTSKGISLSGSDPDGDPISYVLINNPTHGTLTGIAPALTYVPQLDYHGSDSFSFKVNDGVLDSPPATVSVTVNSVNDPPTAANLTKTTNKNTPASVTLSGGDVDGDVLSYFVVSGPTSGGLTGVAPSLTYTPNSGFLGTDTFTYEVHDSLTSSSVATVTINVVDPSVTVSLRDGLNGYQGTRDTRIRGDVPNDVFGTTTKMELDGSPDQISLVRWDTTSIPSGSTVSAASIRFNVINTSSDTFEVYEALHAWDELTANYLLAATGQPWNAPGASGAADHAAAVLTALTSASTGLVTFPLNAFGVAMVQKWVSDPTKNFGIIIQDLLDASTDDLDVSSREASGGVGPMLTVTYSQGPPANQPPVATSQSISINEDGSGLITLSGQDPEGHPLSFIVLDNPANGALSGTAPALTYTPSANFHGTDSFHFKVNDGTFDSPAATVSITINSVNDPPVASGQAVVVQRNGSVAITLSAADIDSSPLTYSVVGSPSSGSLTGTAPNLTYTPNSGFTGSDSFTFRANDGTANSNTATVSIDVQNTAPVGQPKTVTTDEDLAVAITLSGSDLNGDVLTFTLDSSPSNGNLTGTAPNLTYTPNLNFNGSDSFRFKVSDGLLESPLTTVSITVNPVNDAPVAANISHSTNMNSPVPITLLGSDVDANPLTFSIVIGPSNGSLTGTVPNLTYTPNAGTVGLDSFTYRVNDGIVDSNTATVSINVLPNSIPTANPQSVAGNEDTALPLTLTGSDLDGDPLTFSIDAAPSHGTFIGVIPELIYLPDSNFSGLDSFTFKVSDGFAASLPATVSITINAINDPPVASGQSVVVQKNSSIAITLAATDVDSSPLTYSVVGSPSSGSLTGTAPDLTYTPNSNFAGLDSFTFLANDGTVNSNTATISIDVQNSAPSAQPQNVITDEDTAAVITLSGSDPNGDVLTYVLDGAPSSGSLTGTVPNLTYTPNANFHGSDSFRFKVSDGLLESPLTTVSITINSVNDAPVAGGQSVVAQKNGSLAITLSATDVDSSPLTYSIVGSPSSGSLTGTAPNLTYTPNSNFMGLDSFTFLANDGTVDSNTATISIDVQNSAPTAQQQTVTTNEDTAIAITLSGTDPNGDVLTYVVDGAPSSGSLTGTVPNLTYTPNANFNGSDSFRFKVSDGLLESPLTTISITVSPVNDAPTAVSFAISTNINASVPVTLSGNDIDGNPLTYSIVGSPGSGSLSGTAPNLTYTPTTGFAGTDTFTYQVNDGTVSSASATVTVNVLPVSNPVTISFQYKVLPQVSYIGVEDTKIRGDEPTTNLGTSSKLELDGKPDISTLVKWNISQIPTGSTIDSVSLTINVINTSVDSFFIYQMLRPWTEMTATYTVYTTNTPWQIAGAQGANDRGTTVLGTVTGPSLGFKTIQLNSAGVAVVQAWLNNSATNNGFSIQNYLDPSTDDLDFTSNQGSAQLRPKLTITYVPPSSSSSLAKSAQLASSTPANAQAANSSLTVLGSSFVIPNDARNTFPSRASGVEELVVGSGTKPSTIEIQPELQSPPQIQVTKQDRASLLAPIPATKLSPLNPSLSDLEAVLDEISQELALVARSDRGPR